MSKPHSSNDAPSLRDFLKLVFGQLSGLVTSGMIYLGHHLGLYGAMQNAGPLTSEELAEKAGLHERCFIKSLLAVKIIANPGNIGPGASADFPEMRSVKTSLGEQLASNFKDAGAGRQ